MRGGRTAPRWSTVLALVVSGVALMLPAAARAQDADALAKQANSELRAAERLMFAGKSQAAWDKLQTIAPMIQQIKTADPEHRNLASLERKYNKLEGDLKRRLPAAEPAPVKPAPGAPKPVPAAPAKPSAPAAAPSAGSAKLPGGVSKRIRDIDAELAKLDRDLGGSAGDDWKLKQGQNRLGACQTLLDEIDKMYGDQVPDDHPEMAAVEGRVADARKRVDELGAKLAASAPAKAEPSAASVEQARKDGERVVALYQKHHETLSMIHGNSLVYGLKVEDAQKALSDIEDAERGRLPELQPVLAECVERYGRTPMEINNALFALGIKGSDQFGTEAGYLIEDVENVDKSRKASAETIARNAKMILDSVGGVVPDIRVKKMQDEKTKLQIGQQLDPTNPDINQMLANIDEQIGAMAEKIEADIDSKSWAGNVGSFQGPGSPKGLAKDALAYFRAHQGWGGRSDKQIDVLAVAVRGDWLVAERDIFGRVVRWRLPIHVAVSDPDLAARNAARVYELSIVARQGEPGNSPKAPPFDGYWVGSSWMIRPDKI